jgi:hypothetical protein
MLRIFINSNFFLIGLCVAGMASSRNYYAENKDKPNSIINMQTPKPCEFPDRKRLIEHIKKLGGNRVLDQKVWQQLSADEKQIVAQDIIFATTPHVNRKNFKPDGAGCSQYGLVPLSLAAIAANGQRISPVKDLFAFQEYVNKISSMRICANSNIRYEDAPYRSFFYAKSEFSQIAGYVENSINRFNENPEAYSRAADTKKMKCPNEPETAAPLPSLTPVLDSSLSCNSNTDGDTLLFDKGYLTNLVNYISENRDPFGGVVFGCWPGWQ